MTPTLFGPSHLAVCTHCDQAIRVAWETFNPALSTRCPSCGGLCELHGEPLHGDRVSLRSPGPREELGRLDIVGLAGSGADLPQVKRIWGLPGEHVQLRSGELWIDGQLFQKSLEQFHRVRIPVAAYPEDRLSHFWVSSGELNGTPASKSDWARIENSDTAGNTPLGQRLSWRSVRPARVHPTDSPPSDWLQPSPIVDDYRSNQGVRCLLHPVEDYSVTLELSDVLTAPMTGLFRYRDQEITIAFTPVDTGRIENLAAATIRVRQRIEVALCDDRLLLASDTEELVYEYSELDSHASSQLDAFEWMRLDFHAQTGFRRLQVYRDLYLPSVSTESADVGQESSVQETSAGFYLLGDNLPVSIDSRSELGRVDGRQILGLVEPYVVKPSR